MSTANEFFCDMTSETHTLLVSWTAHPARQRPRAAIAAATIVLLVGMATWFSFGEFWGIGAVVILTASLNRFFLPSRFEVNEHGFVARFPLRTQRIEWREVRRFVTDEHGGYLSTRAVASRMDAFRGVHLLFGAERQTIVDRIPTQIRAARIAPSATPATLDITNSSHDAQPHLAGGAA
jgi:hypothetical protein